MFFSEDDDIVGISQALQKSGRTVKAIRACLKEDV
jgi:hypothetical protein